MSTDNNTSKGTNTKFALLAGILAFGLLTASFVGGQMLNLAVAQSGEGRTVTSIDEIDCEKVKSTVHCVDDVVAKPDTSTSRITPAPIYHSSIGTSTVSTSGTATTKVQPDKFSVTVGVETNGTTAEEAASSNTELVDRLIAALRALGIAEDQINTSSYNVFPIYEYKEPAEVCIMIYPPPPECVPRQEIVGYKAVNSITVTLDVEGATHAGEVIDTSIQAGANNVNGVYFFISAERQEEIRDSLIGDAINNARHRAQIAAEAVGMTISGFQSINLNDVYYPIFSRSFDATESRSTPILPGQQEVSMTVNIVFFIAGSEGSAQEDNTTAADNAMATARQFILSKLPSLGIQIDSELDLHTDMLVHVSESEFHLDFGVMDVNGQSHDGHIEIVDGEITVAVLDGQSIL